MTSSALVGFANSEHSPLYRYDDYVIYALLLSFVTPRGLRPLVVTHYILRSFDYYVVSVAILYASFTRRLRLLVHYATLYVAQSLRRASSTPFLRSFSLLLLSGQLFEQLLLLIRQDYSSKPHIIGAVNTVDRRLLLLASHEKRNSK